MVGVAELPPLSVRLGPAPPLPPVPPLSLVVGPPVAAGASEMAGATALGETDGAEVAGEVLTSVVVGLESAPLSSLLQPDNRAIAAAVEEMVRNAVRQTRDEFFTALP
jgi:hypothetical protein